MDDLHTTLRRLDPDQLRSGPASMRHAVESVVAATADVWTADWPDVVRALADVGALDLCLGRLVEGHADAMRILDQAGVSPQSGVYGVWASRSAGTGLRATRDGEGWRLDGELRFASGIDVIDRALVPGWVDDEHHLLFDVAASDFVPDRDSWPTSAMDASRSFTCACDGVPGGEPVGPTDFYLQRPGFAIGGLGPAAVWAGGVALVTEVTVHGVSRFPTTAHQRRRLGLVEQARWQAEVAIRHAATAAERGGDDAAGEVSHARTAVADACDVVVAASAMIVGPGGLSTNTRLIRARDDLALYVRQHHLDGAAESYGQAAIDAASDGER